MKILRIKFDNLMIFDNSFDINFVASDRIMKENSIYKIWGPISTQQTISLVGINAVGKTTSIKLINLAMEIILNNKGLNEMKNSYFPTILVDESTENNGVIMTVYFYKENEVFELQSKIKYRKDLNGEVYFYYEEEILKVKSKSQVKSKNDIFNFTEIEKYKEFKRSKLDKEVLEVLKDDTSIAIRVTKGSKTTVSSIFENFEEKSNKIHGNIDPRVLNVFDDNLKKVEKIEGEDGVNIEFKNSETKIRLNPDRLEDIISSGTIKGQKIIRSAIIALKNGGYLIIDELENHLNKELVKTIINIFSNKNINKRGACLVFTTHYSEILDSFDRKDNVYVLTRDKNYLTKVNRYSDMVERNELKKSDVILSNYIKGTAPKAIRIKELEEYICKKV